ncbi:unnamed protein product [Cyprideis torosa]|uniref:Band 7 domain-containing protein n=1 Tax=Cyprideis torosa TaxID=163714 RepID=A0A7R8ZLG1_9CRUS|nr:unnamed protein product [Cyprideis torosa]CAG0886654.1 unnamed protein product [Cyprideis torosa]
MNNGASTVSVLLERAILTEDTALLFFAYLSGGCFGSSSKRTIVGGWAWAWWFVTDVQELSLEVMTINPRCESVETAKGVPLTVTGVAQCKIMTAAELLQTASEQFLGKSVFEIQDTVLQTLEGHLRAILVAYRAWNKNGSVHLRR